MQASDIKNHFETYHDEIEEAYQKHKSASAKLSMSKNPQIRVL